VQWLSYWQNRPSHNNRQPQARPIKSTRSANLPQLSSKACSDLTSRLNGRHFIGWQPYGATVERQRIRLRKPFRQPISMVFGIWCGRAEYPSQSLKCSRASSILLMMKTGPLPRIVRLLLVASAETAAKRILRAIRNRSKHAYITRRYGIIALILKLPPARIGHCSV
jgi:hypothetical protein